MKPAGDEARIERSRQDPHQQPRANPALIQGRDIPAAAAQRLAPPEQTKATRTCYVPSCNVRIGPNSRLRSTYATAPPISGTTRPTAS
jgi:hypothetical protein